MATIRLFVGGLNYKTTEEELEWHLLELLPASEVNRINIIINRDTGVSKGFAFVWSTIMAQNGLRKS